VTNYFRWVLLSLRALIVVSVLSFSAPFEAQASDKAFGQYLSGECVTCHRKDGENKGIPAIVGWPVDQFVAVLQAYKQKDRPNQVMQTIAGRLTDQEMAALAAYFASETQ
jgi:cytochrome c